MATRMVAQLNRRGIARANLQDLFSHSTLSDFCAHLQAATSGEDNPIPLCQGDGEETLFVFHASDGDISAWLPLASALNRRVFGLQAKSPQRFATLDQMIDEYVGCIRRQQPHGPYVLAGWSYGAFLAAGAAQRLYAKGEQVRMVLIDPVCRQDFCCENRAALLRLLAEGQTPLALPEHFDQQMPDSQLADFISLAKTAGMVSQNLTLQAAETWLDNIAHLLRLLTEHTPGESVPVPCLMVYAAGRPAHWTPAETEWQGWINNADDAVIEASHWQIMMEAPTFRLVRNTLRAGFAQPQRNRRTRYDAVRLPKTTRTDCGRQIWRNVPECLYAAPGGAGTGRPAGAGSARSRELAHAFGIPLYTSPEQITRMPDIACIVVRSTVAGGTGTQLARHFLTRGVHVIQEHPLHPDDISSLQTLAQEQGCCYWVNTFYPHTRAGRTWLRDAQQLRRCLAKTPQVVHATTSRQLLYSTLDLLLLALGVDAAAVECDVVGSFSDFHCLRLFWPEEKPACCFSAISILTIQICIALSCTACCWAGRKVIFRWRRATAPSSGHPACLSQTIRRTPTASTADRRSCAICRV